MAIRKTNLNLTAIIITAIIVAGVLITVFYAFPQKTSDRVIEVVGNTQFFVKPDKALVYIQIQTNGTTAEESKNKNADIYRDVLDALKVIGITDDDIETENYNIYPHCEYTPEGQKCSGFIASNAMKITTTNFYSVSKIVDSAVDNGALINYINFELTTQQNNFYKAEALRMASEDAKAKAEAVAAGQGKQVGNLVSISVQDYQYFPIPLYRAAESTVDVKQAVTNIQPKNIDVSATVIVKYEIG